MKRKFLALFALLLIPAFAFLGCGDPETFYITTNSSKIDLGSGSGGSNSPIEKGSARKIVASALNPDTNPFLCWLKDYSRVASTEEEYQFTVNEQTAGTYTAVFADDAQAMPFATLSTIGYGGQTYSNFSYSATYNLAGHLITLCQGESSEANIDAFDGDVFYLESLTSTSFTFNINIVASSLNGETENLPFAVTLNNDSFAGEATFTFSDGDFTFVFEKLNAAMFAE